MNRLSREKQIQIISALVEGNSMRATSRMANVSINTVVKLLQDVGTACAEYHDTHVRNLQKTYKVQVDEIWNFVYSKDKNVPAEKQGQFGIGSMWTWVAIDADSKLCVSYLVGNRDLEYAMEFMKDVKSRLAKRIQLSTDGFAAYRTAVEVAFQGEVEFAQVIKLYAELNNDHRYSPAECTAIKKEIVTGRPVRDDISTSYVERQNLTMRMSMRRFTRLTNAFSKKVENLMHSVSLHFMYYNFVRVHQTLRCSPAMEAGVTNHLWNIGDIVDLLKEQKGHTKSN